MVTHPAVPAPRKSNRCSCWCSDQRAQVEGEARGATELCKRKCGILILTLEARRRIRACACLCVYGKNRTNNLYSLHTRPIGPGPRRGRAHRRAATPVAARAIPGPSLAPSDTRQSHRASPTPTPSAIGFRGASAIAAPRPRDVVDATRPHGSWLMGRRAQWPSWQGLGSWVSWSLLVLPVTGLARFRFWLGERECVMLLDADPDGDP